MGPEFMINEDLIDDARTAIEQLLNNLEEQRVQQESKSDQWQESDRGYEVQQWIRNIENTLNSIDSDLADIEITP